MDILTRLLEPTTCKIDSFSIEGPTIVVVPIGIVALLGFVYSMAWAFKDARKRNKNGFLAVLFIVFAGWPVSLFWWQWIRPPEKEENQKGVRP